MYTDTSALDAALNALGQDINAYTTDDKEQALQYATLLIDAYTGRHFRDEDTTEFGRPVGFVFYTAHRPVLSVTSITDVFGQSVDYEVASQTAGKLFVYTDSDFEITYKYNESTVPDDVKFACAYIAANYLALPQDAFTSQNLGDLAVSGEVADRLITPSIRIILNKYRHGGRNVS